MPHEPEPRYPHIICNLSKCKGNPFFAVNRVAKAIRTEGGTKAATDESEAESLAYKADVGPLISSLPFERVEQVSRAWVTVV